MFEALEADIALSQGDIIDDCPILSLEPVPDQPVADPEPTIYRVRVSVMTQACDLAQAKSTRALVAVVKEAQDLVRQGVLKAASVRDHIRRGQVWGWYFLPAAGETIPFPESIVDLRDLHTVPRMVLERLIAEGRRVCRLQTPYREHLAQHFAVTYMRIGLPEPYETEP